MSNSAFLYFIIVVIKDIITLSFEMKSLLFITLTGQHNETTKDYIQLRELNETNLQTFDDIYNIMTIDICIGIPHQCFKLLYDTGIMYMIVGDSVKAAKFSNAFNSSVSQTIRTEKVNLVSLTYRTGILKAREVIDYVYINDINPSYCFHFLLGYETSMIYSFDGILGLGRLYPERNQGNDFDRRFSFIDYLYDNKLIKRKVFGHEYINRTYGKFYIDEIPHSLGDNYFRCVNEPFIPFLLKWHCEMRSLSLSTGENFTEINSPVAFDTGFVDVRGPKREGKVIFQNFLNISGVECHIEEKGFYQKFICNPDFDLRKLPHLYFNLKGMQLTFFNEDMFRLIERRNRKFLLSKIILDVYQEYWQIGEPVLKNYNMVFDYDNNIVGIVSNINYEGDSWVFVILLSLILTIIIIIVLWLIWNRKKLLSKRRDSKQPLNSLSPLAGNNNAKIL